MAPTQSCTEKCNENCNHGEAPWPPRLAIGLAEARQQTPRENNPNHQPGAWEHGFVDFHNLVARAAGAWDPDFPAEQQPFKWENYTPSMLLALRAMDMAMPKAPHRVNNNPDWQALERKRDMPIDLDDWMTLLSAFLDDQEIQEWCQHADRLANAAATAIAQTGASPDDELPTAINKWREANRQARRIYQLTHSNGTKARREAKQAGRMARKFLMNDWDLEYYRLECLREIRQTETAGAF